MRVIKNILKIYIKNIITIYKISKNPVACLVWILKSKLKFTANDYVFVFKNDQKLVLRKSSNDIGMLLEFHRNNPYHRIPNFEIKDHDIVFDLGANIGVFTINAALKNTHGQIYSVEPMDENYRYLNQNIGLNNINNVTTYNIAISNFDGNSDLNISSDSAFHSLNNVNSPKVISKNLVTCKKMSSLLSETKTNKINYLKVDIEGSEYDLIYSLTDEDFSKIEKIVFEIHPLDKNRNLINLSQYLIAKGYKTYDFKDNMLYAIKL